ncbi:hypothetical protein C8F04DRAFT_1264971 [Mycena alexandri]|uniref:Uncharacterized protein n=1 Tax=Mycena alexandri TaxID=1745969 RepID=A0AAD6SPN4_9AGAR|nr:hypothetical protein C8F04DRAFT_1264971 [Mycena alexandri]
MSRDPRSRPKPTSGIGYTTPVLLHQPPSNEDVAKAIVQRVSNAPSTAIMSNDPVVLATRLSLPAYAILTDPKSRMIQASPPNKIVIPLLIKLQPQFLNRDTYGILPAADRRKEGESTYQLVYDVAADVRERFANDQPIQCRPFTISTAQSEFLGTELDTSGRESINFVALNANITGYDAATERPFSIVGHLEVKIYVPPGSSTTPWALEAPCPTRLSLKQALNNYEAYERPFYAFPVNSTSLRPSLDYLQPQHPHCVSSQTLPNPAGESLQVPNVPRDQHCIPPIEADTLEIGRAIHNSTITHGLWQPTPNYRYYTIPQNKPLPKESINWEFLGRTITGAQRWRERRSDTSSSDFTTSSYSPTTSEREDSIMSFSGELPDVPDDTEGLNGDFSKRNIPTVQKPSKAIIVQIPDKRDPIFPPL